MGYKLGKMVNKVFILLILTVSVLNADVNNEPSKLFSIEKISIDKEARIFSIIANPDNIFIKNILCILHPLIHKITDSLDPPRGSQRIVRGAEVGL